MRSNTKCTTTIAHLGREVNRLFAAGLARRVATVAADGDSYETAEACGEGALVALALWLARSGAAGCDATGVVSVLRVRDRAEDEWAASLAAFLTGDDPTL